ncbi:MAG: MBL fold metallo-hydrolase [Euryarchaeota archaeon]|nr:MBL fold metallo-hydrolase [Euryarchaeota archaeon]
MAQVTLLTRGYMCRLPGGVIRVSPSVTLIKDSGINVLVDPGANAKILVEALARGGLAPNKIDLVFLTHYHPDHVLNIRLFPDKDILDVNNIYRGDLEIPYEGRIPGTKIEVVPTPGHAPEHAALLVDTDQGRCLVAGDLFWWPDDAVQKTDHRSLIDLEDEFASDHVVLAESRRRSLEMAEYVIPGHGKPFAVNLP